MPLQVAACICLDVLCWLLSASALDAMLFKSVKQLAVCAFGSAMQQYRPDVLIVASQRVHPKVRI